ncbi:MAG: 23S rRNA (pseudouridine(1915)-N(3))-methyltransferase RlmH [Candidatus Cloacimonetes bacterium]|nr:23S rRNA (pseudouridine(1915)-N(3))-methyltransferase RlmH [Candidatus Cloacimonadota bacterium]
MILRILQVGKTRSGWIKEGISEYLKRLEPLIRLEIVDIPDVSLKTEDNPEAVKAKEAALCLKRLAPEDRLILLDERGETKTSLEFAAFLNTLSAERSVAFLIGGVYGTHSSLKDRASACLSLSKLTFTHQLARLFLIEQIYRALMINHGRSYHY